MEDGLHASPDPTHSPPSHDRKASWSKSQDSPSPSRPSSPDTTVTTPEQSIGEDDDIWDTSSDHHHHHHHSVPGHHALGTEPPSLGFEGRGEEEEEDSNVSHPAAATILSDVPQIRRQHMTDGYREGLSVGKARVMQKGFDAGYPVGVEVGLRVGNVLGILEGVVAALNGRRGKSRGGGKGKGKGLAGGGTGGRKASGIPIGIGGGSAATKMMAMSDEEEEEEEAAAAAASPETQHSSDDDVKFIQTLYARAQEELKISALLKELDDEKIAAIPDVSLPTSTTTITRTGESSSNSHNRANDDNDDDDGATSDKKEEGEDEEEKNTTARNVDVSLPQELEAVLVKWEALVLGALERRPGVE